MRHRSEKKPKQPGRMLLVAMGATVLEQAMAQLRSRPLPAALLAWLCAGLEFCHTVIGRTLVLLGRLLQRAISPLPWSCRFGLLAVPMAVFTVYLAVFGEVWCLQVLELSQREEAALQGSGFIGAFTIFLVLAAFAGVMQVMSSLAAFARHRFVHAFLRASTVFYAAIWLAGLYFAIAVPGYLYATAGKSFDKWRRNELWLSGFWICLAMEAVACLYLLCLGLKSAREFYGVPGASEESLCDRIVADILGNGSDPRFRTSAYWSISGHLFVLFIYPLLAYGCGMMAPYGVPKGTGLQTIQMIRKKPKKKKKDRYVLNMNSPIMFWQPNIDESKILEEVDEATQVVYQATGIKSGLGKGGPGKGGWPHGMENVKLRFIRLKYNGGDWDQDMGIGSDYNMLIQINKMFGFPIAPNTEAIPITALKRFPKHRAPPFVFITGRGNISVTNEEVRVLRWYCTEECGMIFADNGGGHFDSSFRSLVRRIFPNLEWIDIPNDDIIYRQPFLFLDGAPPLWCHSGRRALGIKWNSRWVIFYHQGDLNDAWKTGHAGVSEEKAAQAYKLGINVINYAFNQYMAAHFGD